MAKVVCFPVRSPSCSAEAGRALGFFVNLKVAVWKRRYLVVEVIQPHDWILNEDLLQKDAHMNWYDTFKQHMHNIEVAQLYQTAPVKIVCLPYWCHRVWSSATFSPLKIGIWQNAALLVIHLLCPQRELLFHKLQKLYIILYLHVYNFTNERLIIMYLLLHLLLNSPCSGDTSEKQSSPLPWNLQLHVLLVYHQWRLWGHLESSGFHPEM